VRIVETIRIERPPEDVWAVVSDPATHTDWRPSLVEFRQVSDGPLGVGARIREVLTWGGRTIEIEDVVTAFDPPRRFAARGGWKTADFDVEFRLEPQNGATTVTMDWPLRPRSLALRLAAPFLKGSMRRSTLEELELLKAYVERGSSR
jgi:uncharacterized protein YndB with AHSA1/START domain